MSKVAASKKETPVTNIAQARAIFNQELKARAKGKWDKEVRPNKAFRQHVLARLREEVPTTGAGAPTLYNTLKKEAEQEDPNVGLGRDVVEVEVKAPKAKAPTAKEKVAAKEVASARAAKAKAAALKVSRAATAKKSTKR